MALEPKVPAAASCVSHIGQRWGAAEGWRGPALMVARLSSAVISDLPATPQQPNRRHQQPNEASEDYWLVPEGNGQKIALLGAGQRRRLISRLEWQNSPYTVSTLSMFPGH